MSLGRLIAVMLTMSLSLGSVPGAERLNVLILLSDDQRADTIAALGNTQIRTPNIDRLVKRGVSFDRAYMQGSMNPATCVPSRAMLLSGRSLFHVDEQLRDTTWPEAFQKAGYRCFATGKWHNGERSLLRSFPEAQGIFLGGMTDPFKARLTGISGNKLSPSMLSSKHTCEVFADEAIRFLKSSHDRPFFCYVAFNGPHDPHIVPDDFPIRYDAKSLTLPKNTLPQHPFDNGEMTIRDEALLGWPRSPAELQQMLAEYYRYVSYVDHQIGRILEALDRSPAAEKTLVVFAADSGVARGSHGLLGKQNCYEHSLRIPLILTGPGIPAQKRTSAMCYLYDLLPSVGSMCQVPAPVTSEGIDLSPTFRDPQQPARTQLVFGYKAVQRAIRTDRWKLIRYPQVDRTQLYDLQADPEETTDLARRPESAKVIEELLSSLKAEQSKLGDKAPLTVPNPRPAMWTPPVRKEPARP